MGHKSWEPLLNLSRHYKCTAENTVARRFLFVDGRYCWTWYLSYKYPLARVEFFVPRFSFWTRFWSFGFHLDFWDECGVDFWKKNHFQQRMCHNNLFSKNGIASWVCLYTRCFWCKCSHSHKRWKIPCGYLQIFRIPFWPEVLEKTIEIWIRPFWQKSSSDLILIRVFLKSLVLQLILFEVLKLFVNQKHIRGFSEIRGRLNIK